MADPLPRIFISSVMDGYAAFRDAAANGIRQAGCEPVRVEDFPAGSTAPRTACLDGLKSADAIVLLLGARYGYIAPSGLAATEEEYAEARRLQKPILVFVETTAQREPHQAAFLRKVEDYVTGHLRKGFHDVEELRHLVEDAVRSADLTKIPAAEAGASTRLEDALERRPEAADGIVWLHTAWTTLRNEEVIDPVEVGDPGFQRTVQRLAHETEPPLLGYTYANRTTTTTSLLRVEQGDAAAWGEARDLVVVELHTEGTLAITQNVSGTRGNDGMEGGLFDLYFIDPETVRERLTRAWTFAAAWWDERDPHERHNPLLHAVALHDVGARKLAPPQTSHSGGVTVPPECPENPLRILPRPRRVARPQLRSPADEIERAITLIARRFEEWKNRW